MTQLSQGHTKSAISRLDSGPGHSVFIAGASGSPAKLLRAEVVANADAAGLVKNRVQPNYVGNKTSI